MPCAGSWAWEAGLGGLVAVRGSALVSLSGFAVGYVGADGREQRDGLAAAAAGGGEATPDRAVVDIRLCMPPGG